MNTEMFPQNQQELKSYWNRPGGKFGIIMAIGLALVAGYYALPILTSIIWNTVNFGIALVCGGAFFYAITHKKFRMGLFYLYEILMKKFIGIIIEMDVFIIAEDYINDMEKSREALYQQSIEVDTQKEKTNLKITEKQNEINKLTAKAQAAKIKSEKDPSTLQEVGLATRQIGRLNDYIKQLTPIRDNLTRIGDYLTQIHKNSEYLIMDAKNDLEVKKDLYNSVTSGNKALNSALKIFKGDPEKKLMVEQSMEYLKDDIAGKLANMKKAIDYSSDFMRSIDLDNATFEQEGLLMLENVSQNNVPKLQQNNLTPVNIPSYNNYNDLLK